MIRYGPVLSIKRPMIHGRTIDPILPLIKNLLVIFPVRCMNDSVNVSMVAKIEATDKPNKIVPIHNIVADPGKINIKARAITQPAISITRIYFELIFRDKGMLNILPAVNEPQ